VLFLQLFTRFFAQLGSIGGTVKQNEKVLTGLGIRGRSRLATNKVRNREQTEQHGAADNPGDTFHKPTSLKDAYL
jgi:hypothetical protein